MDKMTGSEKAYEKNDAGDYFNQSSGKKFNAEIKVSKSGAKFSSVWKLKQ